MPGILLVIPESHDPTTHIGSVNGAFEACSTISAPSPKGACSPGAITTRVCHPSGVYICCGKDNGRVTGYDAETGSELRMLYRHAPTVNIEALAWSPDGFTIASSDDTCRIMVAHLSSTPSQAAWASTIKLDFSLDRTLDGAVRQLLVQGLRGTTMYSVKDGFMLGARQYLTEEETPCWLTHAGRLLLLGADKACIYDWDSFSQLSRDGGIALVRAKPLVDGSLWKYPQASRHAKTKAYTTWDGKYIVSATEQSGSRAAPVKCSFRRAEDIHEAAAMVLEHRGLDELADDVVVGLYDDRVVFLDRELWVSTVEAEERLPTRRFFVPFCWRVIYEERLQLIVTRAGDFVFANRQELIVVKKGLRSLSRGLDDKGYMLDLEAQGHS